MTSNQNELFTAVLRAKQIELSRSVGSRDGITVEKAADSIDEIQFKAEREIVTRNLTRDSAMLKLIDLALARIANGTYGICANCEETIAPKRMAALPWAAYCVKCQEKV